LVGSTQTTGESTSNPTKDTWGRKLHQRGNCGVGCRPIGGRRRTTSSRIRIPFSTWLLVKQGFLQIHTPHWILRYRPRPSPPTSHHCRHWNYVCSTILRNQQHHYVLCISPFRCSTNFVQSSHNYNINYQPAHYHRMRTSSR